MRAVEAASRLGAAFGAEVFLLHVIDDSAGYSLPPGLEQLAQMESVMRGEDRYLVSFTQQMMARAASRARMLHVRLLHEEVRVGRPSDSIAAFAKERDIDLIVMGRHGADCVSSRLLGDIVQRVMQLVDCACLTVR